jgi:hypothetical protein
MRAVKRFLALSLLAALGCGSSSSPSDASRRDGAPEEPVLGTGSDATTATSDSSGDATTGNETEGGDASPATSDAGGGDSACAAGCTSTTTGTFCNAGETQWTCQPGKFNPTSFNAYCRDAATNAVRYCCPATFVTLCD